MDFPGPDPADFAQVEALNRAFLDYLAGPGKRLAGGLRQGFPRRWPALMPAPGPGSRSVRSSCSRSARTTIVSGPRCLPASHARTSSMRSGGRRPWRLALSARALAFLWPYAVHNPYAARVLSGAGNDWCERIADCALVDLIEYAGGRGGLLRLRRSDNTAFWRRLLVTGACDEDGIRQAAHVWALQSILTRPTESAALRLPAAACSMPVPAMQVTDRSSVSHSTSRRYNTPPHEGPVDTAPRKDVPQR